MKKHLIFGLLLVAGGSAYANCIQPPVSCRVSSPFGHRIHPVTGQLKLHRGMDFACPVGTTVNAAHSGSVIGQFFDRGGGNTIKLGSGALETKYLHNHSFLVGGTTVSVSSGEAIARSGNTGAWTTGPHLHFEAWKNGTPVDPNTLFCSGPMQTPGVLDGNAGDTDPNLIAHNGAVPPGSVAGPTMIDLDGSHIGMISNIISARALNPDYQNQLASLSEERLYAEISYIESASMIVKRLTLKSRERFGVIASSLNSIKMSKYRYEIEALRTTITSGK